MSRATRSDDPVLSAPFINNSALPQPILMKLEEPYSITVQISGYPKPSVRWNVGRKYLKESSKYKLESDGDKSYTLTVTKVTKDLEDGVWVVASNNMGEDSCKLEVKTYKLFSGTRRAESAAVQPKTNGSKKLPERYHSVEDTNSVMSFDEWQREMDRRNTMRSVDDLVFDSSSAGGYGRIKPNLNESYDAGAMHTSSLRATTRSKTAGSRRRNIHRYSSTEAVTNELPGHTVPPVVIDPSSRYVNTSMSMHTSNEQRTLPDVVRSVPYSQQMKSASQSENVSDAIENASLSVKKKKIKTNSVSKAMASSMGAIETDIITKDHLAFESEPRVISSKKKKKSMNNISNSLSSAMELTDRQPSKVKDHFVMESEPIVISKKLPIKNIVKPNSASDDVLGSVDTDELWSLFGMKLYTLCRRYIHNSFENLNTNDPVDFNSPNFDSHISNHSVDVEQWSHQHAKDISAPNLQETEKLVSAENQVMNNECDQLTFSLERTILKSKLLDVKKPPKWSKGKIVEPGNSELVLVEEVKTGKKSGRKSSRRIYNEDTLTTSFEDIISCEESKSNTDLLLMASTSSTLPLTSDAPVSISHTDEVICETSPTAPNIHDQVLKPVKLAAKPKKKSKIRYELDISDDMDSIIKSNEIAAVDRDESSRSSNLIFQPIDVALVDLKRDNLKTSNAYIDLDNITTVSLDSKKVERKIMVKQNSTDSLIEQPQIDKAWDKQPDPNLPLFLEGIKSTNVAIRPQTISIESSTTMWSKTQNEQDIKCEAKSFVTSQIDNVPESIPSIRSNTIHFPENNTSNANFETESDNGVQKNDQRTFTGNLLSKNAEKVLSKNDKKSNEENVLTLKVNSSRNNQKSVKFEEEEDRFNNKLAALSIPMIDDDILDANKEHRTIIEEDEEEDVKESSSAEVSQFYSTKINKNYIQKQEQPKIESQIVIEKPPENRIPHDVNARESKDILLPELPKSLPPSAMNVSIVPVPFNEFRKKIEEDVKNKEIRSKRTVEQSSNVLEKDTIEPKSLTWSYRNNIRASPTFNPNKQIVMPVIPIPEALQKPVMLPKPVKRNIMSFELQPLTGPGLNTLEDKTRINSQSHTNESSQGSFAPYPKVSLVKEVTQPLYKSSTLTKVSPVAHPQQLQSAQQKLSAIVTQTTTPKPTIANFVYVDEQNDETVTNVSCEINLKKNNNDQPDNINERSRSVRSKTEINVYNDIKDSDGENELDVSRDMCTQTEDSPSEDDTNQSEASDSCGTGSTLETDHDDQADNHCNKLDPKIFANNYRQSDIGLDPMTPDLSD